jgi:hypothetical protein
MSNEIRINSNLKSLKEKGFVNYFESECFEINRRIAVGERGASWQGHFL